MVEEIEQEQVDFSAFENESISQTIYCACDGIYRSHGKLIMKPRPHYVTQKPCPGCGHNNTVVRVSNDPEIFTIRG